MSNSNELCKCGHDASAHNAFDGGCTSMLESKSPIISNKVLFCHCKKFEPKTS
jgi:hypothetical protein